MAEPRRRKAYKKYLVTLTREIEFTAVVEIEARCREEAEDLAKARVDDAAQPSLWQEGEVIDCKTKVSPVNKETP